MFIKEKDRSVFQFVSDTIGEIEWSDSTNYKAKADSVWVTIGKVVLSVAIPVGIWFAAVQLLRDTKYEQWLFYVFLVLAGLMVSFLIRCFTFKGEDYFMGTEGFAMVKFKRSRKNMTKSVFRYEDIDDIIIKETKTYSKGDSYQSTKYEVTLYGRSDETVKPVLLTVKDNYIQEDPEGDYYRMKRWTILYNGEKGCWDEVMRDHAEELYKNLGYRFWKEVEWRLSQRWYDEVREKIEKGEMVVFDMYTNDMKPVNYVGIRGGDIMVSSAMYESGSVVRIYHEYDRDSADKFVLCHDENTARFMGIGARGYQSEIDLRWMRRRMMFARVFREFVWRYYPQLVNGTKNK